MEKAIREKHTRLIKEEALRLGFTSCRMAEATFLDEEAPLLDKWLAQGSQGQMAYMANHYDKRLDPRKLVEGARSVISLSLNYYTDATQNEDAHYKVSQYAFGRDYHKVIKKKLKALQQFISENIGEVNGRAFVDSAPVMDKAWARRSGMGWMGKNSNIISKGQGSFFFLAELITDLELEYDRPVSDHCGNCTRCIDACPTQAITAPYVVDGSRCISYFTIELKDKIPEAYSNKLDNWIFGCDVCQEVCPWNRFSTPHTEAEFEPRPDILSMNRKEWEEITEEIFDKIFPGSPVKRAGYKGLIKNINTGKGQK